MNAPKFTTGPWMLCEPGLDDDGEERSFYYVKVAPHRYITTEGRSQDEANANAWLCAAAPELYAALERLVEKCDNTPLTDDSCIDTLGAHAALAKARGETP